MGSAYAIAKMELARLEALPESRHVVPAALHNCVVEECVVRRENGERARSQRPFLFGKKIGRLRPAARSVERISNKALREDSERPTRRAPFPKFVQ